MLIPAIATEYHDLVDEAEGRVHARVTLAREPTTAEREPRSPRSSRARSARPSCRTSR